MFGLAERWGYIESNPCRRMQAPSVPKREPTVPAPDRHGTCDTDRHAGVRSRVLQFRHLHGLSARGEIAGLRWGDFNAELGIVIIRRSIDSTPGNGLPKETKTASAKVISLDPVTLRALAAHKLRQADEGLEIEDGCGRAIAMASSPIRPDRISDLWAAVRDELPELEGVRFHDIRHATATWLIAAGMDPRTVADRLGHDDVKLTLSTYTAPVAASDRRAATIISDLLAAATEEASADPDDGERSGS
jgi:integrase